MRQRVLRPDRLGAGEAEVDGSESIDELGLSVALCSLELAAPLASRRDCMILDMEWLATPFPAFVQISDDDAAEGSA